MQSHLINHLKKQGYLHDFNGECFGLVLMWIQSILAEDTDSFDSRINTLMQYNSQSLIYAINQTKEARIQCIKMIELKIQKKRS